MAWKDSAVRSATAAAGRYWGYAALAAWAAILLGASLVRFDAYGIDEAAARALLLAWSVGEHVPSTIFVLGLPDLRAVLFAPLAAYWPGSLVAPKVHVLIATAGAAALFYRWSRADRDPETALLATGLLLIAPITLLQSDAVGAGPYLLLSFAVGLWLDRRCRAVQRPMGGWYFAQLLWIMTAVSLHPLALAYPIALGWQWLRDPIDRRNQRFALAGIGCAVTLILAMRLGWPGLDWLANPITSLARALWGDTLDGGARLWLTGTALGLALILVMIGERRRLMDDLMRRMMVIGLIIGLVCADAAWAMLAVAALLFLGLPRLIEFNQSLDGRGFAGQRGIVMTVMFIALLIFMQVDKAHRYAIAQNHLPAADALILKFAAEVEDADAQVLTMSQWPGKTMLALKRPVLPLPPDQAGTDALLATLAQRGVDYLLFDQKARRNELLASQLAEATGAAQTLMVEEGGVAVHVRKPAAH